MNNSYLQKEIEEQPQVIQRLLKEERLQIFAWGLTLAKGFDPDHPRGLRKVTLTR